MKNAVFLFLALAICFCFTTQVVFAQDYPSGVPAAPNASDVIAKITAFRTIRVNDSTSYDALISFEIIEAKSVDNYPDTNISVGQTFEEVRFLHGGLILQAGDVITGILTLEGDEFSHAYWIRNVAKIDYSGDPPDDKNVTVFQTTGTICYQDLEGGFYGICGADGNTYLALNLPSEFMIDGLEVTFEAKIIEDVMTIYQWGTIIELISIEPIGSGIPDDGVTDGELEIKQRWENTMSSLQEAGEYIVKSHQEWEDIRLEINALEEIGYDFTNNMIIGVSMGEQISTGYSISIEKVVLQSDGSLKVYVSRRSPAEGEATGDALTQPYSFVMIEKHEGQVVFEYNDHSNDPAPPTDRPEGEGLLVFTDALQVEIGDSFTIEVAVRPVSGSSGEGLGVGDQADAYLYITPSDDAFQLFLVYDAWGNVNFAEVPTPIVSNWPVEAFEFTPVAEVWVPDDPSVVGTYNINALMIHAGASFEGNTANVNSVSVEVVEQFGTTGGDDYIPDEYPPDQYPDDPTDEPLPPVVDGYTPPENYPTEGVGDKEARHDLAIDATIVYFPDGVDPSLPNADIFPDPYFGIVSDDGTVYFAGNLDDSYKVFGNFKERVHLILLQTLIADPRGVSAEIVWIEPLN